MYDSCDLAAYKLHSRVYSFRLNLNAFKDKDDIPNELAFFISFVSLSISFSLKRST